MGDVSGNKELVEQFFVDERKKHRRLVMLLWVMVGIGDLFAMLAWFNGVEINQIIGGQVVLCGFAFVMFSLGLRQKKTLQERLRIVLASIEFGWDELHGLDLNTAEADHLHVAFSATTLGRTTTNESYLRTRGVDEKGPAFDDAEAAINTSKQRVDPLLHEEDYAGLEGDLRVAEQLVEEANQQYADEAQRQWDIAEAQDMDNIEAGVERLGDLVATGWFEQNAKDGAVEELMNSHRQDESP